MTNRERGECVSQCLLFNRSTPCVEGGIILSGLSLFSYSTPFSLSVLLGKIKTISTGLFLLLTVPFFLPSQKEKAHWGLERGWRWKGLRGNGG